MTEKDKSIINEFNYKFFGEYIDRSVLKNLMDIDKIYTEIVENIDNGQAYSE